jgi:hypothetical protein
MCHSILLRIAVAVCPVQDAPNLLKFGMLILHCGCWTAVSMVRMTTARLLSMDFLADDLIL